MRVSAIEGGVFIGHHQTGEQSFYLYNYGGVESMKHLIQLFSGLQRVDFSLLRHRVGCFVVQSFLDEKFLKLVEYFSGECGKIMTPLG